MDGDKDRMPLPTVLLRRIKHQLLTHLRVNCVRGHGDTRDTDAQDTGDTGHVGTQAGRGGHTELCLCPSGPVLSPVTDRGWCRPRRDLSVLADFIWEQSLNVLNSEGGIQTVARFRVSIRYVPSHLGRRLRKKLTVPCSGLFAVTHVTPHIQIYKLVCID